MSGASSSAFEVIVIGGGPAGQKAAIAAAKAHQSVLLIDKEPAAGGECVLHGTIPSKTLRETAMRFRVLHDRLGVELPGDRKMATLLSRLDAVVDAHRQFMTAQVERNGITFWHGRARFLDPHQVEIRGVRGERRVAHGRQILIAAGSRPRTPPEVAIDHEHLLDSDSILSLPFLPRSLLVLGGGVIACEYATIFASLGTAVTIVDRADRPLAFLDPELSAELVARLRAQPGCSYRGGRKVERAVFDGAEAVVQLDDGSELRSEKLLCALGRVANLDGLAIEAAGLRANERGLLPVDAQLRTPVPHIFAAGDVIGPPSLASASMEQGRRAMCHALGQPVACSEAPIPIGIYTIPEISCVGMTEAQAREQHGDVLVGRARFGEVARAQIAGVTEGLLKIVTDACGARIFGVHVIGEGATELIHVAQMAIAGGLGAGAFVDNVFNFPTLAEAYRIAALDVARQQRAAAAAR